MVAHSPLASRPAAFWWWLAAARRIQELFRDRLRVAAARHAPQSTSSRGPREATARALVGTMLSRSGERSLRASHQQRKLLWRLAADELADASQPTGETDSRPPLAADDALHAAVAQLRKQAQPVFRMTLSGQQPDVPERIMACMGDLKLNICHLGLVLQPDVISRLLSAVMDSLKSLEPILSPPIDPLSPPRALRIDSLSRLHLIVDGALVFVPSPDTADKRPQPGAWVLNLGQFTMRNSFEEEEVPVAATATNPATEVASETNVNVAAESAPVGKSLISTMALRLAPSDILVSPNFVSSERRRSGWLLRTQMRSLAARVRRSEKSAWPPHWWR